MSNIILQPSSNKDAREHYVDTIANPVKLEFIRDYIDFKDFNKLKEIYPSGNCKIWGVTPSKINFNKWKRIKTGDITLFSKKGKIYSSATTTYKLHSKDLAVNLWNYNNKGQTWEYIYFIDEVKNLDIPYIEFNRVVGYADNYIIQGFNILDDDKSKKIINGFDLESEVYSADVSYEDFKDEIIKDLDVPETDKFSKGHRRVEQSWLRQNLFGRNTIFSCCCCGNDYPISFLITAHIKKRNLCSREERLDKNVVIPMCKFGCDDLFEKGYISVKDGKFIRLSKSPITENVKSYLKNIDGRNCKFYNDDSKRYFEWHYKHHS